MILITGVTGGLGQAVARAFLDAGYEVVGVARGEAEIDDGHYRHVRADLTQPGGIGAAMEAAEGRVRALVHVLGGFAGGGPVAETSADVWANMLNLNLTAAFFAARAVLPGMIARGDGRLIFIGSRTGVEPAPGLSAYGVSKAGLIALARTIALETRGAGVTANVINPGTIDTAANRKAMPGADFKQWVKPEEIARAAVWLASPEAAAVNGAVIPLYGGA